MISVELVRLELSGLTEGPLWIVWDLRVDDVLSLGLLLAVIRFWGVTVWWVISFVIHSFLWMFLAHSFPSYISSWRSIWCSFWRLLAFLIPSHWYFWRFTPFAAFGTLLRYGVIIVILGSLLLFPFSFLGLLYNLIEGVGTESLIPL